MLPKSGHFWTNYLPCLLNVICEQPLRKSSNKVSCSKVRYESNGLSKIQDAHQLANLLCKNTCNARQKRKREREGCIYLTDLPIPHVAQYTLSQLYIGHIRRCLLQRERLSHQTGRTLPVLQASC